MTNKEEQRRLKAALVMIKLLLTHVEGYCYKDGNWLAMYSSQTISNIEKFLADSYTSAKNILR